jgi:O-antigen/teichoic acid export membrane protein
MYSVQAVGVSASALAASSLIVSFVQFGTNYSLPRFLPTSKNRVALINTLHNGMLLSTVIGSAIFLVLPSTRQMYVLGGWLFAPVFIVVSCLQTGVTFLGLVLVADRAAGKLTASSTIPNFIKLASPYFFRSLGDLGAFIARTVYNLFQYIIVAVVLVRRGHRFRPTLRKSSLGELGRFSAGMYVASTIGGLPQLLLPVVALSRLGAAGTAYWSIAYTIATLLYQLPSVITQALLPEISSRATERRFLLQRAALMICGLVYPALVIAFFAAPIALLVFGHQYVAGALTPTRLLIAAGFITSLNYVTGAVLFLGKKSAVITVVNIVDAVIVLGLAGVWATTPTQVAIAWFIGDIANTVLFGVFAYLALREVGYRYENLGADQARQVPRAPVLPEPASASHTLMPASLARAFGVLADTAERQRMAQAVTATGPLTSTGAVFRALDVLAGVAEQQRGTVLQDPSQRHRLTEPHGLYSVLMFQEAERDRASADSPSVTPRS